MVRRERDMGGRLMRDMKRRRRTTLLKAESVRPGLEGLIVWLWRLLGDC